MSTPKKPEEWREWTHVKVLAVTDGDTVRAELLDLEGEFDVVLRPTLRLFGINTPEKKQPGYDEAVRFVAYRIGGVTRIRTLKREKYGRMLAQIYCGAECLNDELVKAGLAKVYLP